MASQRYCSHSICNSRIAAQWVIFVKESHSLGSIGRSNHLKENIRHCTRRKDIGTSDLRPKQTSSGAMSRRSSYSEEDTTSSSFKNLVVYYCTATSSKKKDGSKKPSENCKLPPIGFLEKTPEYECQVFGQNCHLKANSRDLAEFMITESILRRGLNEGCFLLS
jgi:hypothetical protein